MKKIAIITSFPRIQRVDFYNEMQKNKEHEFNVFYLRSMPHGRHWKYGPKLKHNHKLIKELRIWKHLYLSPRLLREFVDYNPDMMIMTQYASPGMQLLMYYCSIKKIPWIFWAEAPHVRYETPFVKNEKLRTILRKIAMIPIKYFSKEVWGVGDRAVEEYKIEFGLNKIYKNLPYYSDLRPFFKIAENRKEMPMPCFLFSGSLSYRKGADLFLSAIKLLANEGLIFSVVTMGIGRYYKDFKLIEHEYDNVKIDNLGFIQLNNVPEVYQNSNILVFPSRHDGWGMTLPEGMASSMAVITTTYAGCAIDTIEHNENGMIVDTNIEALSGAMRVLIKHTELITILGKKAQLTIKSYTHNKGAKKFDSYINKALLKCTENS